MEAVKLVAIASQVMLDAVVPGYMKAVSSALSSAQEDVKTAESKGLPTLEQEAKKQKVVMEFQAHQARVAQELAIAERIATSHEVVIEEYYDGAGKGHAGFQANPEGVSLGASGEARRVTKRVIRFSGWSNVSAEPSESPETLPTSS